MIRSANEILEKSLDRNILLMRKIAKPIVFVKYVAERKFSCDVSLKPIKCIELVTWLNQSIRKWITTLLPLGQVISFSIEESVSRFQSRFYFSNKVLGPGFEKRARLLLLILL